MLPASATLPQCQEPLQSIPSAVQTQSIHQRTEAMPQTSASRTTKTIKCKSWATQGETRRRNHERKSLIRMVMWWGIWTKWRYSYQHYGKIESPKKSIKWRYLAELGPSIATITPTQETSRLSETARNNLPCEAPGPTRIRCNNQSSTLNRSSRAVSPPARPPLLSTKVTCSINRKTWAVATSNRAPIMFPPQVSLWAIRPPSRNLTDLNLLPSLLETKR